MSAVNGAVKDEPMIHTLPHAGTRRQAEVAGRVWGEERGTVVRVTTTPHAFSDGLWYAAVVYYPWST